MSAQLPQLRQRSLAGCGYPMKKRVTRREQLVVEMEQVVPWERLQALVKPMCPTGGGLASQHAGVSRMLRLYLLQQWLGLTAEALEDAIYDRQAMRAFVEIDLSRGAVPDATTLLKFRRLLEEHKLTKALFEVINAHQAEHGLG